jgi:heme-degrading monooxygenase HmoA
MNCTRMIIGEAASDELLKQIVACMQEHVANTQGLFGHSILVEEGGRMVILITHWPNRQDCLIYHTSRAYRQFVAGTLHMLVGDYVVKLFENKTA